MKPSSGQRSSSANRFDYMCEWDVPKECDLKKETSQVQAFNIHQPTIDQMKMMPDFGFFKLIK